jgi:hypothetical protein
MALMDILISMKKGSRSTKRYFVPWLAPSFTFVHLGPI